MKRKKKIASVICLFLAFVMFTQLLPMDILGGLVSTARADGKSHYTFEQYMYDLENAKDSSLDTEAPETFVIDTDLEEYVYVPRSDRESAEIAQEEYDYTIIDLTAEEKAAVKRYYNLLEKNTYYSDLSKSDAEFFCKHGGVLVSDMKELDRAGYTLERSMFYALLAEKLSLPAAEILALNLTNDEYSALYAETRKYCSIVSDEVKGTELDAELKTYLLEGFTFEEVKTAYGVSRALELEISDVLSSNIADDTTTSREFESSKQIAISDSSPKVEVKNDVVLSAQTEENFTLVAEDYGVEKEFLIEYATENELGFMELEKRLAESDTYELELMGAAPMSTNSGEDPEPVDKNVGAPYSYDYNASEAIGLNSGSLMYQNVDYVLPGIAGLDLTIGRRYDSNEANVYAPSSYLEPDYEPGYFIQGTYVAHLVNSDGSVGARFSAADEPIYIGPFSSYAAANEAANYLPSPIDTNYTPTPDSQITEIRLFAYITDIEMVRNAIFCGYVQLTTTSSNKHFNSLYGLGSGWSFAFSSIENGRYLRLSDGRAYEISITSTAGDSNLKDYTLSDLRIEQESGGYSNGNVSSAYTLYYKNGTREYFSSDGKLIGIRDKYNNTIKFVNDTYNGYPRITITDTLNRVTVISGAGTSTGHVMTVALPENVTLTYEVESITSPVSCKALSAYTDAVGSTTDYSYTVQSGGFDVHYKSTNAVTNYFLNLTTITHPTGAQSVYTYETTLQNLGSSGLQTAYRITSRKDMIGTDSYNEKTYTYSAHNNTGYPAQSNPTSLPDTFTYSTTVTDGDGVSVTTTFDSKHLKTTQETKYGSKKISEEAYEYNTDKLPVKVTTKVYDFTNQNTFMQSIVAAEYDNKGNTTASWSAYANGNTSNTEFKTTYTYDPTYSMPLSVSYKKDAGTTVSVSYTLDSTKKNVTSEKVSSNGTLQSRTDYVYDSYGNITTKRVYKTGLISYYTTTYSYQDNAYLSREIVSGVLDADGNPVNVVNDYSPSSMVFEYTYDNLGRLISSKGANRKTTSYQYDAMGAVTKITNPDNTSINYARNYTANHLTVTDENGNAIKYTYTALGLDYEAIDVASGSVISRKEYDDMSRLVRGTDFVYGSVVEYDYDYLSRVVSETAKQGNTVLAETEYSYDIVDSGSYHKVTKAVVGDSTSPSVITTQYTDRMGNVAKTGAYLSGTEQLNTYTFDYVGNVLTEKTAFAAERGLTYSTRNVYDYAGRVIESFNAAGNSTTTSYDALGNIVSTTDYVGTPTTYTYDALGRLLTETYTIETGITATTKYYYDAAGNVVKTMTPSNNVGSAASWNTVEYEYDSRGNLLYTVQLGSVTAYTYDGVGNMLTMTTGKSSKTSSDGETTTYTYDRFGNVTGITDQLGEAETYSYTTLGKAVSKTDRNGTVTSYAFDALGRPLSVSTTMDDYIAYSYTKTGAVASESNGTITQSYTYDSLGRLTSTTETGGIVKTYGYDIAGMRTSLTVKVDGSTVQSMTYGYNNLGMLTTVSEGGTVEATYTYDVNGNRSSLTYSNGNLETYTYNLANWVTSLTNSDGATTISSFSYTYYADGNQRTKTNASNAVTTYVYDSVGRLSSATESGGMSIAYTYDRFSNRSSMTVTSDDENYTTTYVYDAANRLITETKSYEFSDEITSYYYDLNGNQVSKVKEYLVDEEGPGEADYELIAGLEETELYAYNGLNQLVEVWKDEETYTYAYNTSGIRASKDDGTTETKFVLDGGNVIAEVQDGTVTANYVRGMNLIYAEIDGSTSYYLYNAHGDVVDLTTTTGAVVKSYDYDAFGNEKTPTANDTNPFRYCGEYWDDETGTYYLRARYYDPSIGRFSQQDTHWNPSNMIYGDDPVKWNEREPSENPKDPLGVTTYTYVPNISAILQSGNLYNYCMGNPVAFFDPSGNLTTAAVALIATVACALVGGISSAFQSYKHTGKVTVENVLRGALDGGIFALSTSMTLASLISKVSAAIGITSASNSVIATGQWHHILSNPIMRALSSHPILRGLFDRATSTVQALTQEAHRGYQTWHRLIDNTIVQWLKDNPSATANQFWQKMYELYNTPEMIGRFGRAALDYIKGMMK